MPAYKYSDPSTVVAPVADTSAGLFTFTSGLKSLYIRNTTGETIYLRINGTAALPASATVYDAVIATGADLRLHADTDLNVHKIDRVSIWVPSGGTAANIEVRGR